METMTNHHPEYGQKLTAQEQRRLFGNDSVNSFRGIVQKDGLVWFILVKVGAQQTYPNEVTSERIKYCYAAKDGRANTLMKKMYHMNEPFLVKVVPDKSPDTYFWGKGRVEVEQEDYTWEGRTFRRFVIVKAEESTPLPVELPNPPAAEHTSKRRRVDTTDSGGSSSDTEAEVSSILTMASLGLEGVDFDSHLERLHAAFMSKLHIPWTREVPTYHRIQLGSGREASYTPDFVVYLPGGVHLLEIKPCYPYLDEVRKAVAVVRRMHTPLVLFYNTAFRCPFEEAKEGTGQGSYDHHSGIRGIKFSWDPRSKTVRREESAAYSVMKTSDSFLGNIDVLDDLEDTDHFTNDILRQAYRYVEDLRTSIYEHYRQSSV